MGKVFNKDIIISMLKRMIVQLILILLSLTSFLIFLFAPLEIELDLRNQLLSITVAILTGAFLSLLYVIIEKRFENEVSLNAEKQLDKKFHDLKLEIDKLQTSENCTYCKFFIRSLKTRDDAKLEEAIKNAKKRVFFLTTNLFSHTAYITKIQEAVERGVDVKLLVLKPTSFFVKLRYKEIGLRSAEEFFDQMNISLREFVFKKNAIIAQNPNLKFEIKTHLHFPSCMIFIIDEKLYFNPILPFDSAKKTSHILYDLSHSDAKIMADNFIKTFNSCWNDGEAARTDYVFSEDQMENW